MRKTYQETPFSLRRYIDGYEGHFVCKMASQPEFADPCSSDMTEAEIAACVDLWLKTYGWETYPEVALKHRSKRPDLIANKSHWVHVIECKKAFGLPVMEQAFDWLSSRHNPKAGLPHMISIAVKCSNGGRRSEFGMELIKKAGIGLIEVEKRAGFVLGPPDQQEMREPSYSLRVMCEARLIPGSRRLGRVLREQLNTDTRMAVAGTPGATGRYMTDWKRTMLRVEEFMRKGDSHTTSEVVSYLNENGGHHWCNKSSAMTGINMSLQRLRYGKEEYAHGNAHRWKWVEGKTKSIIQN
ncbi:MULTISPECIES: hypothetical protein [Klebsiella pneumoniae complex]|uniref:hypothetical protein n=1 Tax=Klebsiella pneumoniae complex TaxID=3390273 RepID=UPI00287641E0|nr:hypothetical protein [Klebsiella quasipneumoniae]MDS1022077.1 hypothetical protein [Klebsiella quasipneumoniae]